MNILSLINRDLFLIESIADKRVRGKIKELMKEAVRVNEEVQKILYKYEEIKNEVNNTIINLKNERRK